MERPSFSTLRPAVPFSDGMPRLDTNDDTARLPDDFHSHPGKRDGCPQHAVTEPGQAKGARLTSLAALLLVFLLAWLPDTRNSPTRKAKPVSEMPDIAITNQLASVFLAYSSCRAFRRLIQRKK